MTKEEKLSYKKLSEFTLEEKAMLIELSRRDFISINKVLRIALRVYYAKIKARKTK